MDLQDTKEWLKDYRSNLSPKTAVVVGQLIAEVEHLTDLNALYVQQNSDNADEFVVLRNQSRAQFEANAALQQRVKELTCQKTALQQVVSERDEEIRRLNRELAMSHDLMLVFEARAEKAHQHIEELREGLEKIGNGEVIRGEAQALARTIVAKEGV